MHLFIFGCTGSSLLHGLFFSCSKQGLLFVVVHGLLIAVASLNAEHRLWGSWPSVAAACRLTSTVPKVVVLGLSYSSAGGNFLDLGSDSCLLHWQADSYPLHSQGSPRSVLFNFQKCRGALFYYQPITFLLLFNRCVVSNSSVTPWTVALTGSSVHGVSQEYRGGLPFPSPGDLPDPGIEWWLVDSFPQSHLECYLISPVVTLRSILSVISILLSSFSWPQGTTCGILVPRAGIELRPSAVKNAEF